MKTVTDQIQKYKQPVVTLQVLWPNNGTVISIRISQYPLIDCVFEVGFIVNVAIVPLLVKGFTTVSDGLCVWKVEEHFWDIVIINWHAPTEEDNRDIKEFTWILRRIRKNKLHLILETVPIQILKGDFNS
jgi:hypothetical protein